MEHLSDIDLERYCLGMIPDGPELAALEEHLLICGECVDRAEEAAHYVDMIRAWISRYGGPLLIGHLARDGSGGHVPSFLLISLLCLPVPFREFCHLTNDTITVLKAFEWTGQGLEHLPRYLRFRALPNLSQF